MEKKADPNWQQFMSAKLDGGVRNANMSNFIQKANVFQNEMVHDTEHQRTTIEHLDIKLGKVLDEVDQPHHVEFRNEPLRPKQTIQEREMWLVARPLIQEFTTLNIVKEPTISPYSHRISADIHNNLEALIKKSENLYLEKKNQTVPPSQTSANQQKVINQRFLETIRKTDQSFSPIQTNYISQNQQQPQKVERLPTQIDKQYEATASVDTDNTDKRFDFREIARARQRQPKKESSVDVALPHDINDIKDLKRITKNPNMFDFQIMQDEEYMLMEDQVEKKNFDTQLEDQAREQRKQHAKIRSDNEDIPLVFQRDEVDLDVLDFNSIISVAGGNFNPDKLKRDDIERLKRNASSKALSKYQSMSTMKDQISTQNKKNRQETDEDEPIKINKCVGTTPRQYEGPVAQRDESLQISSLNIIEDVRNIPRVGVILNQISSIKKQYSLAAEKQDKVKLRYLLNHRLIDLMNLIMLSEKVKVNTINDAVEYLLAQNKTQLSQQNIDGVTKLDLFYIFLTEYKNYKQMCEDEINSTYKLVNQNEKLLLVQRASQRQVRQNMVQQKQKNRKEFNSLAYHFRSSPRNNDSDKTLPRYMQSTYSNMCKYDSTPKNSKKQMATTPTKLRSVKPFEDDNWITGQSATNNKWTKVS